MLILHLLEQSCEMYADIWARLFDRCIGYGKLVFPDTTLYPMDVGRQYSMIYCITIFIHDPR
jgi:hypothetical protein